MAAIVRLRGRGGKALLAKHAVLRLAGRMDLDALLHHYFGSNGLEALDAAALEHGKHRLAVDFGTEREPGRRFALWSLMEALGIAPPPAEAFAKEPALCRAAEDYLSAAWRLERDGED